MLFSFISPLSNVQPRFSIISFFDCTIINFWFIYKQFVFSFRVVQHFSFDAKAKISGGKKISAHRGISGVPCFVIISYLAVMQANIRFQPSTYSRPCLAENHIRFRFHKQYSYISKLICSILRQLPFRLKVLTQVFQ